MPKSIPLAAALQYDKDQPGAPIVVAAGRGSTAERIIETAQMEGVPVCEDQALSKILVSLEVGTEIPPELYQAVAQIIAFVWKLERKHMKSQGQQS